MDLGPDSAICNATVAESTALALAWFLTRDEPLVARLGDQGPCAFVSDAPALAPTLLRRFRTTDDPYVLERLLAGVYGACCTLAGEHVRVMADAVYEHVFTGGRAPQHLLARDYVLGVVERASFLGVLPEHVDMEVCRSPHTTPWPLDKHTNAEVDALAASVGDKHRKIARSCTTEYGRGISGYGDFGRYVLESHVREFLPVGLEDQRPTTSPYDSRSDGELIGNWVAWRAYGMGMAGNSFPERQDARRACWDVARQGRTDRKEVPVDRNVRTPGILSDHVWCKGPYDDAKTYHAAFDVEFCRDIDPTVVSHELFAPSLIQLVGRARIRRTG